MRRPATADVTIFDETTDPGTDPGRVVVPAQGQKSARRACSRCGGLLVGEWCIDLLDETGQIAFDAWRCISCGHVLDAVMQRNRLHPPVPRRRPVSRREVVSMRPSSDPA